jgi:hypothetical protein
VRISRVGINRVAVFALFVCFSVIPVVSLVLSVITLKVATSHRLFPSIWSVAPVLFVLIALGLSKICIRIQGGCTAKPNVRSGLIFLCGLTVLQIAVRQHLASDALVLFLFVAAASEEIVFRSALPDALRRCLLRKGLSPGFAFLSAYTVLQVSFAGTHFVSQSSPHFILWREAVKLLLTGLLYVELLQITGLWFTSLVHAAVNYAIGVSPGQLMPITWLSLFTFMVVATLFLLRRAKLVSDLAGISSSKQFFR